MWQLRRNVHQCRSSTKNLWRVYVENLISYLKTYCAVKEIYRHPRWLIPIVWELCAFLAHRQILLTEYGKDSWVAYCCHTHGVYVILTATVYTCRWNSYSIAPVLYPWTAPFNDSFHCFASTFLPSHMWLSVATDWSSAFKVWL